MPIGTVPQLAFRDRLSRMGRDMTNAELHALRAMAEALPEIAKQLASINKNLATLNKAVEAKS